MTSILHTADLHLDLEGSNTGECWTYACRVAVERGVDAVVIAGDAFTRKNPRAVALNEFAAGMRILEEHDVPAIAIPGNHDAAVQAGGKCVLEAFHDDEHLVVVTRPQVREVGGVRFACLPWVTRQYFMAKNPGIAREDADVALFDVLQRVIDMLRADGADVLTGHWSVEGSVLGGEVGMDLAVTGSPTLPRHALEGPWSYAAMGHIHRAQPIPGPEGESVLGTYCGSIDRLNFGEEHYTPSVTIVDLLDGNGTIALEHVPVKPARRLVTITDVAGEGEMHEMPDVEGAVVRLRLSADHASRVDEVRRALVEAGAVSVTGGAERVREVRARASHVNEALSDEDALEAWFDLKSTPEDERPALRETAKEIAEEVAG